VTKPLTLYKSDTKEAICQDDTPVVRQLKTIFEAIPDGELLKALKVYYAGRNGYTDKVLWYTYVAMVILNLPSFAALIRALQNNPYIAWACGISNPDGIPSKFAYSRFVRKLQIKHNEVLVKGIMRKLTLKCYETLPQFGETVAIDSTDMKAWSNGTKERKTDPDAGWVIKLPTSGKAKFVWGYKLHLMVDAAHEIPIAANITRGSLHDIRQATALLHQARETYGKFHPEYVLCDAGYNSENLRKKIKKQFRSRAIIKSRKTDKSIANETPEWKLLYDRRVAVERCFSRMKGHRRLNNVTVRGRRKVSVHSLIPVIVTQAVALAFPNAPRCCVC
jgi:transposase